MKKRLALATLILMGMQMVAFGPRLAYAVSSGPAAGDVVINEIAWMGTADSSSDEWLELYNASEFSVDLTGWTIEDDITTVYKIVGGEIAPHGYFMIEDTEESVSGPAGAVIGLSFANAGDSLVLKAPDGSVIDSVNVSGGAWYAGDSVSKATMERIDPGVSGDNAENWASAVSGNGAVGRSGSQILGTPGRANSNYGGDGAEVYIDPFDTIAFGGDEITLSVNVNDVTDLYAYGFELTYSPYLVEFMDASEGDFLKVDGASTAFNAGLINGQEGQLLVGNARLANPAVGIDGSGELFTMRFKVVSPESDSGSINFGASSFLSNSTGDIPAKYTHGDIAIGEGDGSVNMIAGLNIDMGLERYSLALNWQEDLDGANSYLVTRKGPDGSYAVIGETADASFLDTDGVVPFIPYSYQVIAVKNNVQSDPVEISGMETRGLVGDTDRSDRVDGRDIENLARAFGSEFGDEEYAAFADTNFDGIVDGSDLIDVGANFASTYTP